MTAAEAGRDRLVIDNMDLSGSRFTRVSFGDACFGDTSLKNAELNDVNATGLWVENANLSGARFHNVTLAGAVIDAANLSGLAITNADLTDMTIDGVRVSDLFAAYEAQHGQG